MTILCIFVGALAVAAVIIAIVKHGKQGPPVVTHTVTLAPSQPLPRRKPTAKQTKRAKLAAAAIKRSADKRKKKGVK